MFDQKANAQNIFVAERWELFWEAVNGKGVSEGWTGVIVDSISNLKAFFVSIFDNVIAHTVAGLTSWSQSSPTVQDYADHKAIIDKYAKEGKQFLLIAHSQGNLFVSTSYDYAAGLVGTKAVKVVHVAPASPVLKGAYTLADRDIVINGLRILRIGSVPDNNVFLPPTNSRPSPVDLSGHGLIETYLNEGMDARAKILKDTSVALDDLSVQVCPLPYELVVSIEDFLDPPLPTCTQYAYPNVYTNNGKPVEYWDVNLCIRQALFRPQNIITKEYGFDKSNQPLLDQASTFCNVEHSHFAPNWRPSVDGSTVKTVNVDYESMVLPYTNQNEFLTHKNLYQGITSYKDIHSMFLPDGWGFRYENIQSGSIPYDQAQVPLSIFCQIGFSRPGLPVQTISTSISVPDVYSAGVLRRYFLGTPNYNRGEIFINSQ